MMTAHPDQVDPKYKHNCMICRSCVKLPQDVNNIDASIDTQIMIPLHILLFHVADLDNGQKPDIGTLKKYRGDIFSECCTESFKAKFLRYFNGVLLKW